MLINIILTMAMCSKITMTGKFDSLQCLFILGGMLSSFKLIRLFFIFIFLCTFNRYEHMHTCESTSPANALDGIPKKMPESDGNDATELELGEMEPIDSHMPIVKKRKAASDEDTLGNTSSNESSSGLVSMPKRSAKQRRICTDNENQTVVFARYVS